MALYLFRSSDWIFECTIKWQMGLDLHLSVQTKQLIPCWKWTSILLFLSVPPSLHPFIFFNHHHFFYRPLGKSCSQLHDLSFIMRRRWCHSFDQSEDLMHFANHIIYLCVWFSGNILTRWSEKHCKGSCSLKGLKGMVSCLICTSIYTNTQIVNSRSSMLVFIRKSEIPRGSFF